MVRWRDEPSDERQQAQTFVRDLLTAFGITDSLAGLHPDRSLADHYGPLAMDHALINAHHTLDAVVDRAFDTKQTCATNEERMTILFDRYTELTTLRGRKTRKDDWTLSLLETLAHIAAIVTVFPVIGAAVALSWRLIRGPRGLVITQTSALPGDPGFFVTVSNGGDEEQVITKIGVIPTRNLPLAQLRRSIAGAATNVENLNSFSVSTSLIDAPQALHPGRRTARLVPPTLGSDPQPFEVEANRIQFKRWQSWCREEKPPRLTPFVVLEDGTILLGKRKRMQNDVVTGGVPPLCVCGHFVSNHEFHMPTRMARREPRSPCTECRCSRFKGSPEKSLAALEAGEVFARPNDAD